MMWRWWNNARTRYKSRDLDGVILVDKPSGQSSNAILQKVRRLFSAKKAGHAGTLDPLASGALLICFGRATKLCRFLLNHDKCYQVVMQLGAETDTGDADGAVVKQLPVMVNRAQVEACVLQFCGILTQVPPMYSALKHEGQPLYRLARAGVDVVRAAREVTIYHNRLLHFDEVSAQVTLDVRCSKGTYIRSLVEDMGRALGCGAHVLALRRTVIGGLDDLTMHGLTQLEAARRDSSLDDLLMPSHALLSGYPILTLTMTDILTIRHGRKFDQTLPVASGWYQLHGQDGGLFALMHIDHAGAIDLLLVWLKDPLVD